MNRKSKALLLFAALFGLATPVLSLAQTTHTITVGDNFFSPANISIAAGDTVRWVNAAGGNIHNVTSGNGAFASSQTASSFTFEVTFNNPGDFPYDCTIHFGMSGTITVVGEAEDPDVQLVSVNALDEGESVQAQSAGFGEVTLPKALSTGDSLTIEAVIRNNDDSTSAGFDISYYASTDALITAGDTSLGNFAVGGFAGGAMSGRSDTVDIPDGLAPGQYFIGAILSIDDPNLANNTAVDATSLQISGPFYINSGLNDAWAIVGVRRQGILIAVWPSISVPTFFGAWFTYELERPPLDATAMLGEPGHRWVTLQGGWTGDTANLQVYVTAGGVFAAGDPLPNNAVSIGTMTIEFHDCSNATLTYDIPSPGPFGSIPAPGLSDTLALTRSAPDANNIAICEELNLALQEGGN